MALMNSYEEAQHFCQHPLHVGTTKASRSCSYGRCLKTKINYHHSLAQNFIAAISLHLAPLCHPSPTPASSHSVPHTYQAGCCLRPFPLAVPSVALSPSPLWSQLRNALLFKGPSLPTQLWLPCWHKFIYSIYAYVKSTSFIPLLTNLPHLCPSN